MSSKKETRQLISQIEKWPGWRVEEIKAGWKVFPPNKSFSPIIIHATPSDHRAVKNTKALLRKAGAPI